MSQSTFPLSFFTCHTLIFPCLKQESTSLCTCIAEKSILEFSTAIIAVLIADCSNRKQKNWKKKKKGKKRKKALTTKNLPGLLKYDPAAKTSFRICIENRNYHCGSHRYSFWKEINIDIFSTDRTPLTSLNLHIILFTEGKPDASTTGKTNPFPSKCHYTEKYAVSIPFSVREQLTNHQKRQFTDISIAILRLLSFLWNNSEVLPQLHPRLPLLWPFCSF